MKLKQINIENFKGLKCFEMALSGEDDIPNSLTCLLGNNGSGKTTVLQAIALVLSAATRKNEELSSVKNAAISPLRWNGFIYEHGISRSTKIKLALELEPDEITATQEVFEIWKHYYQNQSDNVTKPDDLTEITLVYEFGQVKCLEGAAALLELRGRFFVKTLSEVLSFSEARAFLAKMGDIFWFEQQRHLATTSQLEISSIRQELVNWWTYHHQNYEKGDDLLVELEKHFNVIFPKTQFVGIEPMRQGDYLSHPGFFFLLQRDHSKPYDIAEMSSGEQIIFAILYQFIYLKIARSIILIDELELHLHPPKQQALYASLYQFAPDCQFIVTTHSPYLEDLFLNKEMVIMETL
jgi:predicted ATPase